MSKRKPKTSKRRLRFGDDAAVDATARLLTPTVDDDDDLLADDRGDVAPPDDNTKHFPKLKGRYGQTCGPHVVDREKKDCNARTNKLCTAVLNDKEMPFPIPGDAKKKFAWDWCTDSMKGKPFLSTLSQAAQKTCVTAKGKPMGRTACRRAILESEKDTAVGTEFTLGPKVISSGNPLVNKTVKGRFLVAQVGGKAKKPCRVSSSGEIRDCHYELEFLDPTHAKEKGLPGPGPYMRICGKGGEPGALFPVKSPEEAKALLDADCKCKRGGECGAVPSPAGFGGNRFKLFGYGKKR